VLLRGSSALPVLNVARGAGNFQIKQDGACCAIKRCKLDLPGFKNLEGLRTGHVSGTVELPLSSRSDSNGFYPKNSG